METKVSIIVPVFNSANYLHRCLDSIIQQSYKNLEIIIVNDGATDDSLAIINNYRQQKDLLLIDQPKPRN
jgi:glycosyltransferase involved in cell wall biosynthesis